MTQTYFAFLDALTRIAELKIEKLFNGMGIIRAEMLRSIASPFVNKQKAVYMARRCLEA